MQSNNKKVSLGIIRFNSRETTSSIGIINDILRAKEARPIIRLDSFHFLANDDSLENRPWFIYIKVQKKYGRCHMTQRSLLTVTCTQHMCLIN